LLQTAAAGKEQSEAAPGRELPEPLEKALETLLDQEHAGTPLLKRSINFVKAALLDPKLKIQLRRDNKLEGLPPNWLQLTFRRFCQPDGHRFRIKKRRRSNYVKLFNLIGEALNPYLTADLERVINSGRGARGLAIPSRAILITQAATWLALNRKLEEEVLLNPAADHRKLCMRWVILMVARLGLTFENSLAALAQIQIKHITIDWVTVYFEMARPKDQSQAKVAGERYLRVWLDQLTAIALDTLLVHLARNKLAGVKRRQVQPLHPDIYILTQTLHKPDQESVASLRNELNCYLNGLCQEVGVGITTLEQLSRTARWSLWEQGIYPADVIDGLAGYSPTSPLPDRRVANKSWKTISAEWQTPDALPAWVGRVADNNLSSFSRASSFNTNTGDNLTNQPGNEIEDTQKDEDDTGRRLSDQPLYKARLERIHEITQPLHHLDKLDSARQLATKKRVIKGLQNLGCKWLGVKDPEQLGEALAAAAVASSAIDQATFNLVALVAWLAWLVQKTSITRTKAMDKAKLAQPQNEVSDQPPLQADATPTKKTKKLDLKTIFAYRSDAEAILGLYPTARITELGEDEQDEILEADRVANPRVRRRSAWKSWHDCLRQEYKLPLAPLKLHSVWQPHRTDPEELLTPTDMHELMKLLAQVAGSDLHLARMAFNATPLCYYLMLRISEIIKLKLKDIILYGDRAEYHVLVRKSKRGKSRRIFLQDVPNEVINFLKKLVQARRAELKAQGAGGLALAEAYLICDTHGQLLNESRFSALFTQALRHPTLDRPGATHHYLRKSGASWRYLMGVDPREISLALGHSTVEITYLSYLRVVDLHQLKAVSRLDCSIEISATEVAPLLDIARPQAERRIIQEGNFSLKEYQVNSRVWQRRVLNTKNVRGMLRADLAKLWFGLTPKCIAHES